MVGGSGEFDSEDYAGDAGGDDWNDAVASELFYEPLHGAGICEI
jgi:hypothetical protein